MTQENNPTPGESVTLTKERYQELLEYERIGRWAVDVITVATLDDILGNVAKLKELTNDARCKAIQAAFQEALKGKE